MGDARERLRAARRPRMIVLLAVLLVVASVFARLGAWQLDRAITRGEQRAAAQVAEVAEAAPAPLGDVLAPQSPFRSTMADRHVVVEGEWGSDVLLVAGRVVDGVEGYLVLAPLEVALAGGGAGSGEGDSEGSGEGSVEGSGSGSVEGGTAVLPVVRGWVADPADLARVAPAEGEARVVGWLHVGEAAGDPRRSLPDGQTDAVSPAELVNRWGGPTYTAYLVVDETEPAQSGLVALGPPEPDRGGVDWRNLGYALQWWLFALFGVVLWWRMLGDEVRDVETGADGTPDVEAGADGTRGVEVGADGTREVEAAEPVTAERPDASSV